MRSMRLIPAVALMAAFLLFSTSGMAADRPVRPGSLAGSWFPGDSAELARVIKTFLGKAETPAVDAPIIGMAVPHAGYLYSGPVAAYGYKLLQGREIDTVILVGPSHQARFPGAALDKRDYQTPLGTMMLDDETADRVIAASDGLVTAKSDVHEGEHCLEIEVPFLQTVLPNARIVPIIMGQQDVEACRTLAKALAEAAKDRRVLLLASTDLSHYYTGEQAERIDGRLVEQVKAMDPEALHKGFVDAKYEACGGGPLTAVMMAAKLLGADNAAVLKYAHSGNVTKDDSRVVGYMAAVFTKGGEAVAQADTGADPAVKADTGADKEAPATGALTPEEHKKLLEIARQTILDALDGKKTQWPENQPGALGERRGAFVTLKRHGELRGCIGRIDAWRPLAETVAAMALSAAFEDPRFDPLTKDELEGLTIEISALTPLTEVKDVSEIEVGRDGLIISMNGSQGLLLPQVATEQGWDREEFLDFTCRKAGLPMDAWKNGAKIVRFQADVFGEEASPQGQGS